MFEQLNILEVIKPGKLQSMGSWRIGHNWATSLSLLCIGEGNGNPLQGSCLKNPRDRGAWWAAVHGVAKSQTWLSHFTFTFHFHALEKEMATHSSVLAWRLPGTAEPGGLPSMGSHRVGHNWSDLAAAAALRYVFIFIYFFWLGCVLLLGFEKQGIWLIIDSIKHLLSLLHSVIFSGPQLHVYVFLAVYPLLSLVSVFHLLHFYVASGLFLKTNLLSHYFSFQLCLFYFLS